MRLSKSLRFGEFVCLVVILIVVAFYAGRVSSQRELMKARGDVANVQNALIFDPFKVFPDAALLVFLSTATRAWSVAKDLSASHDILQGGYNVNSASVHSPRQISEHNQTSGVFDNRFLRPFPQRSEPTHLS